MLDQGAPHIGGDVRQAKAQPGMDMTHNNLILEFAKQDGVRRSQRAFAKRLLLDDNRCGIPLAPILQAVFR
ncbi:hypothetical protein C2W62_09320 [Candidatus Entotheonella serta]|nr:hypothetical protein C2W62_09320 [Candidatus Entotheonella serta]